MRLSLETEQDEYLADALHQRLLRLADERAWRVYPSAAHLDRRTRHIHPNSPTAPRPGVKGADYIETIPKPGHRLAAEVCRAGVV